MFGMRPRPPAPPAFESPSLPQLPAAPSPSSTSASDAGGKMREVYGNAAQDGKISKGEKRQVANSRRNVDIMGDELGDLKQNDAEQDEQDGNQIARLFGCLF